MSIGYSIREVCIFGAKIHVFNVKSCEHLKYGLICFLNILLLQIDGVPVEISDNALWRVCMHVLKISQKSDFLNVFCYSFLQKQLQMMAVNEWRNDYNHQSHHRDWRIQSSYKSIAGYK